MQVHTSSLFERPAVRVNKVNPRDPFVSVDHGPTRVTAESVADCDAMIAAWTEARRLLAEAARTEPLTGPACGQHSDRLSAACTRPAGHKGGHRDDAKDAYWPQDEEG